MPCYDYLIIGAGIMGLTCAYELKKRYPETKVAIVEKEEGVAKHASGRNSGVIHAGIYYANDSLKARFCLEGGQLLKSYCQENDLHINPCGKLIVAKHEAELKPLHSHYQRAMANGATVELVDEKQVAEIDPAVVTYQQAIWSPQTASIMPVDVCLSLQKKCEQQGVSFYFKQTITDISPDKKQVKCQSGAIEYGNLINCAGLYADKVAQWYGLSDDYLMMPFKGLYLVSDSPAVALRTNVYPVPDSAYPFLGVHFTITGEGKTKIGPTALPAFWREQYEWFSRFSLSELSQISAWYLKSFIRNDFQFRDLVKTEAKYLFRKKLLSEAQKLVRVDLSKAAFKTSRPGIRAQLYSKKERKLVNDFVIEQVGNSVHVMNAVSPAFTSAFAVARHIVTSFL